ncbi:FKBP-type peptidyl-prolyl cis-trans isomerase [Pseudomonas sichuanensis]|uniref:FKBP-type peptidyl-prolyl cis-trans isomerase n=1 Tax=Pseudomonas TaxID=286 RepID=UPI00129AF106|nr:MULTISPECIES: FKBP-type peptidyl-prolyl cis-trans isomerase [Pseudomonas]MDH0732434.1 FKBP-type peptidyl-prolyl cis-trans isomerase [Pseudomonas sichuanensis]MDH1583834.1 FKBP-type peptidyl-prolyl cis-trans isomerase [Pseudomonas sichuanensis]MDH1591546.1 FKBP-type peptidyl-prolyl cis-trans isomerase [Pseudomonas sichuanensis]MDH1596345.1 FKBP-type peptidyl-prolyl cis-trans isomerase [Pseudomonas sichuanensis]MDU9401571.1 FKBP-type peptidyl-prolyl cis-trans isomerase [Pseudomonas sp. zfem00
MPRYLMLGLCLAAPLALAAPESNTDNDLAYSIGASLGERLRQEVPGLQLDALVEGLRQAYQGQPPRIDKSRMQAILQQHDEQASAAAQQAEVDKQLAAEKRFMAAERARAGVHELPEGILYSELASGAGAQPKASGSVQVRYVGKLPDGTVFDQSEKPQWFKLNSVIEGWQVALPKMKAGSKWRLVIPSAQAYGAEGAGDLIAPYTPLVFEIELLAVAD